MQSVIGKLNKMAGTGNPARMVRDSDGDKVPNVFDCAPRNPRKQGIIHRIKQSIKTRRDDREEAQAAVSQGTVTKPEDIQKQGIASGSRRERFMRQELRRKKVREARYAEADKMAVASVKRKPGTGGGFFAGLQAGFSRTTSAKPRMVRVRTAKKGYRRKQRTKTPRPRYGFAGGESLSGYFDRNYKF